MNSRPSIATDILAPIASTRKRIGSFGLKSNGAEATTRRSCASFSKTTDSSANETR